MKGFVNIFKEDGMTSNDAVVIVRGILRKASGEKQKVGHLGTLDPLANGVLPVAVGNATRLFDYMQDKIKEYVAVFKFGMSTDTLDRGGKVVEICDRTVSKQDIVEALPELIGEIEQIPPIYSAKCVNGQRAYDIARSGGSVELKPKRIFIQSIKLLDTAPIGRSLEKNEYAFEIRCGSGTYIRAIARDLAQKLGTVGYMTYLCRTRSGEFKLENAVTIEQFQSSPFEYVTPIDSVINDFGRIDLQGMVGQKALNGVKIEVRQDGAMHPLIYVDGTLVGVGEVQNGFMRIKTRL